MGMGGWDTNVHGTVHNEKLSEVTYSPTTKGWTLLNPMMDVKHLELDLCIESYFQALGRAIFPMLYTIYTSVHT